MVFLAGVAISLPFNLRAADPPERLRVIIETDAGGDPDDEQSLVRFLLYANEWDIEGIIANRALARPGENRNVERTGFGIVRRLINAYGECHPRLVRHDRRYPTRDELWSRTVPGDDDTDEAVQRIIRAVDSTDARPVWYSDWGTDHGGATNNLRRALDRVRRERGVEGYARFKSRLRLASADAFGEHTSALDPPFALWVDTFRPELERKRWYHRFSALTARAGGFDLIRDVLTGHGPLGAIYPTNTTHWQKEGDTMTFLYLVPNGLNHPDEPRWGGWAGRYGLNENHGGKPYFWANQTDEWQGTTHRENTLGRWAADLQNDFKARLDWCVKEAAEANHPPVARVLPAVTHTHVSGEKVILDASSSTDPDGDDLRFQWFVYPEAGSYRGAIPLIENGTSSKASLVVPMVSREESLHVILAATDAGAPPLTRYRRVIMRVVPHR